jgi:hypothetical protein
VAGASDGCGYAMGGRVVWRGWVVWRRDAGKV